MQLDKTRHGPDIVLKVSVDRIDAANAVYLKDAFAASILGERGRIVMDLKAVTFMDSSGLGAMVAAMKQLEKPRKLELCNLQPAVSKVFKLTRMDTVFPIFETVEDAVLEASVGSGNVSAA